MRIWTGLKWMIRVGVAPASSTVTIPGRAGEERVTDNVCLWIEKKAFHHEKQNTEDYTGTLVLSLSLSVLHNATSYDIVKGEERSTMTSALTNWALPQLSRLVPLDDDSLKQIITYTDTLPKEAAADHLKNLLGDSPQALEFISSFNTRRQAPPGESKTRQVSTIAQAQQSSNTPASSTTSSEFPRAGHGRQRGGKKKANIHNLPPRQIRDYGDVAGAYRKADEQDYMTAPSRPRKGNEATLASSLRLQEVPDAVQAPRATNGGLGVGATSHPSPRASPVPASSKPPPSASGPLISDFLPSSKKPSRTSSPAPAKTKVNITGGTNMHGAGATLSDLDSAIRTLELQTNPTLSSTGTPETSIADQGRRRCNCMASRHPLLTIAPNCLACGKIVCVKEGLGPCTFCNAPLLSSSEINAMVRVLKDERGKERMAANNAVHKRAEVSQKPRAFTGRDFLASSVSSAVASPLSSAPASDSEGDVGGAASDAVRRAKEHRDKLLGYQAHNTQRTRIHDEASDFDIPASGTNMWASPAERAKQLKQQQKVMREMEWNSRPEWEKRRVVASIDVAKGKIVRKMAEVERPAFDEGVSADEDEANDVQPGESQKGQGAFSNNPLLGALIRPVAKVDKGKDKEAGNDNLEDGAHGNKSKRSMWRRVQDDNDDNEQWILDGGVYGNRIDGRVLGAEEHSFS